MFAKYLLKMALELICKEQKNLFIFMNLRETQHSEYWQNDTWFGLPRFHLKLWIEILSVHYRMKLN